MCCDPSVEHKVLAVDEVEYLKSLSAKPPAPSGLAQELTRPMLDKLPLPQQVTEIMCAGKILPLHIIQDLVAADTTVDELFVELRKVAYLVRGNWVLSRCVWLWLWLWLWLCVHVCVAVVACVYVECRLWTVGCWRPA